MNLPNQVVQIEPKRIKKIPIDSKRIKKKQKDSKEGKYSCKALDCSSWMAKKANGPCTPGPPKFKELDAPALLERLTRVISF